MCVCVCDAKMCVFVSISCGLVVFGASEAKHGLSEPRKNKLAARAKGPMAVSICVL